MCQVGWKTDVPIPQFFYLELVLKNQFLYEFIHSATTPLLLLRADDEKLVRCTTSVLFHYTQHVMTISTPSRLQPVENLMVVERIRPKF